VEIWFLFLVGLFILGFSVLVILMYQASQSDNFKTWEYIAYSILLFILVIYFVTVSLLRVRVK